MSHRWRNHHGRDARGNGTSAAIASDMSFRKISTFLATIAFAWAIACDTTPVESASSAPSQTGTSPGSATTEDDGTQADADPRTTTTIEPAGSEDAEIAEPAEQTENRTPENDPFLLEGIPNLEDLIAMRDGDWLTILASAPRNGAARPPTVTRATIPSLASVQQSAWNERIVPFIAPSETFPNLEPGYTILFLGPGSKPSAEKGLALVEDFAPEAYIKAGW